MKYYKGPNELNSAFYYKWHSEESANNLYGNKMAIHIHQSAELMLVTKGEMKIAVGGNDYETMRANQAALILPFQPHRYSTLPKTEYLRCNFATSLIPEFFNTVMGKEGERAVFDTSEVTVLHFRKKMLEDSKMSLWSIRAFLCSAIDDYLASIPLRESGADSHILTRAIAYMNEHKSQKLSIGDVASGIGYSKSHLSYCINQAADFNFSTLLSMIRIEDARVMLKNTKRSILDIALECGFGSERSFYRQFKAITGISPKDYRDALVFKAMVDPLNPVKTQLSVATD